jgi:FtsP/CotA-like multicopper oxidase with cupredoxin domain
MRLHRHHPQVLALNGEPVTGSPLYRNTVMVPPGRTTAVAVVTTNPGIWMLHYHELHHAAAGMRTTLRYQDSYAEDGASGTGSV